MENNREANRNEDIDFNGGFTGVNDNKLNELMDYHYTILPNAEIFNKLLELTGFNDSLKDAMEYDYLHALQYAENKEEYLNWIPKFKDRLKLGKIKILINIKLEEEDKLDD